MTPYYIATKPLGCWIDLGSILAIEDVFVWDEEFWHFQNIESVAQFSVIMAFQDQPKIIRYRQHFDRPAYLDSKPKVLMEEKTSAEVAKFKDIIRVRIEEFREIHSTLIRTWATT